MVLRHAKAAQTGDGKPLRHQPIRGREYSSVGVLPQNGLILVVGQFEI
jgi:hypothetical protein